MTVVAIPVTIIEVSPAFNPSAVFVFHGTPIFDCRRSITCCTVSAAFARPRATIARPADPNTNCRRERECLGMGRYYCWWAARLYTPPAYDDPGRDSSPPDAHDVPPVLRLG